MTPPDLADRIAGVRDRIAAAVARRGPGPEVTLIAVSKLHPSERIVEAAAAGVRDFGENYAQEYRDKRAALADEALRWHFIGPIQSNKVKLIVGCTLIHTVDRPSVLTAIERRAHARDSAQDVLVQVNLAREPQKAGVAPEHLDDLLARFADLEHVICRGLMLIPPQGSPDDTRRWFHELARLRDRLARCPRVRVDLESLSMGMSGDYETAITEGATHVRIGTALFGPRE